ncbi:MAG TPA: hypothetical protein VFQ00_03090 [Terriglobales bacterium]|nr:hypothetical protein [Terriglobales bacterium]
MKHARKTLSDDCKPGEAAPESGIYDVIHNRCSSSMIQTIFLIDQKIPPCSMCGARVRFRLRQAIPHWSEDEDLQR